MLYYLAKCLECGKYKKLYEEEKQKCEDLKNCIEELIYRINPKFIDELKNK
jgi:hypothetical protein